MKLTTCLTAICLGAWMLASGCERTDSTSSTPPNTGTGMNGTVEGKDVMGPNAYSGDSPSSPGGAPAFGAPSGMGFPTGDAAHSGGQGGGLMGFGGTGANGTNGTITDRTTPATEQRGGVKSSATEAPK